MLAQSFRTSANSHSLLSYYRGIGHKSLLVRKIAIGIKLFIHLIEDLE
jgi:hypothetical protein